MQTNREFIANWAADRTESRRARAALDPAFGSRRESRALIAEMLSHCGWSARLMPEGDVAVQGEALAYADAAGRPFLLVNPEGLNVLEPLPPVLDAAARAGFHWVIATDLETWRVASVTKGNCHNLVNFPRSPDSVNLLAALDASGDVDSALAEFVSIAKMIGGFFPDLFDFFERHPEEFAAIAAKKGYRCSLESVRKAFQAMEQRLSESLPASQSLSLEERLTLNLELTQKPGWMAMIRGGSTPHQAAEHLGESVAADGSLRPRHPESRGRGETVVETQRACSDLEAPPFKGPHAVSDVRITTASTPNQIVRDPLPIHLSNVVDIHTEGVTALAEAYRERCARHGLRIEPSMPEIACAYDEAYLRRHGLALLTVSRSASTADTASI